MLFSKDILFIHVPKTGGMSVTNHLLATLPRPVYYVHSFDKEPEREEGVVHILGNRHESIEGARGIVREHGFDVHEFPLILAVVRNPYQMEVSRYAYLQIGNPWDAGPEQRLALNEDFETFVTRSSYQGGFGTTIDGYFLLDGRFPPNLHIVRLENLSEGVKEALHTVGVEAETELPWVNRSRHDDYRSYYTTEEAEEAVYRRYQWVFDSGFYTRLEADLVRRSAEAPTSDRGHQLPIEGPVRQVGASSGFWPDSWMGERVRFAVKAERPVHRISVRGWLPDRFETRCELTVTVDGRREARSWDGGQVFEWTFPCEIAPGDAVEVEIRSSATWSPTDHGPSGDGRGLTFKLNHVAFQQLADIIGETVRSVLPPRANVMVVSRGDEDLLQLDGRQGWHFPQTREGVYAGHHPGDSAEAITHLETLKERGGGFVLFPRTAFWWLSHYDDFHRHLEDRHDRIWRDDYSIIYRLDG